MKLMYNKEIYPKIALLKAAYQFTDDNYIHIDVDSNNYIVEIVAKNDTENINIKDEFHNELLAQSTRYHIALQTKNIRELIMSRAFASTVVDSNLKDNSPEHEEENIDIDQILTDWFETNE